MLMERTTIAYLTLIINKKCRRQNAELAPRFDKIVDEGFLFASTIKTSDKTKRNDIHFGLLKTNKIWPKFTKIFFEIFIIYMSSASLSEFRDVIFISGVFQ